MWWIIFQPATAVRYSCRSSDDNCRTNNERKSTTSSSSSLLTQSAATCRQLRVTAVQHSMLLRMFSPMRCGISPLAARDAGWVVACRAADRLSAARHRLAQTLARRSPERLVRCALHDLRRTCALRGTSVPQLLLPIGNRRVPRGPEIPTTLLSGRLARTCQDLCARATQGEGCWKSDPARL